MRLLKKSYPVVFHAFIDSLIVRKFDKDKNSYPHIYIYSKLIIWNLYFKKSIILSVRYTERPSLRQGQAFITSRKTLVQAATEQSAVVIQDSVDVVDVCIHV